MAKFECIIPGIYDFDDTLKYFHDYLAQSGITASFEDGSDYRAGDVRVCVRVYERYTIMGDNRLSLTMTLATDGNDIFASAIASGGSGGMVKWAGWGEDEFVDRFIEGARQFEGMRQVKSFDRYYSNP